MDGLDGIYLRSLVLKEHRQSDANNLGGVEYDSFVNYSDHDHAQAVSKAFHRAARDLPFMPLKFPAEGDFNNEEVSVLSLSLISASFLESHVNY